MNKFLYALALLCALTGCKGTKTLLPNVSGKAGEVLVVMEKADWDGAPGEKVRELLACDCEYLPQQEALYSLINVAPGGFADLFKIHRNIVFFDINPSLSEDKVTGLQDIWAAPQCVVNIGARSPEAAVELLSAKADQITGMIEQAERDRVIANSIRYEERDIAAQVKEIFGGSPHFPMGYKLKKKTDGFAWIADEKQYSMQGVFVYRYPATEGDEFAVDRIVEHRNAVLKENVPGMVDGSFMTTSPALKPQLTYVRYKGRDFAQLRGYWEVEGDFMGGPFVSHSFYSADGQWIIVTEAFVYAPKFDKRQLLRQVESILYSWE